MASQPPYLNNGSGVPYQFTSPPLEHHDTSFSSATRVQIDASAPGYADNHGMLEMNGGHTVNAAHTNGSGYSTSSPNLKPIHRDTMLSVKSAYSVPYKLSTLERYKSGVYVIPVTVIIIHTFLIVFSWAFFGSVVKRPIALNPTLAALANQHMQSVTMVTTLVCSFISLTAATQYKKSIRYSISRWLSGRVSLFALTASIRLSQASIINNLERPAWTFAAALAIVAINSQTAGYTALFQPKRIEIKSAITGFELDLLSPEFQVLMESNRQRFTPSLFERVLPLTDSTGSTAVSTHFYLPSIFNFDQFSYFNSTKGILPVTTQQIESSVRSARGNALPINAIVHYTQPTPSSGFPVRFSMTQQGFSGDVKCTKQALSSTTSPSVKVAIVQDTIFGAVATLARLEVVCPGEMLKFSPSVLTSNNIDAMFAISCGAMENGRRRWDLIITGSGKYSSIGTTVCSIFPEVHTLEVAYTSDAKILNSTFPNVVNASEPWNRVDAPWLGDFAIDVFRRGLQVDQSTTGNAMGDTLLSFLQDLPDEEGVLNEVLAQYLRAVLEFSVTTLRTVYTQDNNQLFPGGSSTIPPSMRLSTNGTYHGTTIGWSVEPDSAAAILVAPTLVSLAALSIILFTLYSRKKEGHGRQEPECNYHFDPTDILHVISAASAGGLNTPFPPFHEDMVHHSRGVEVKLKPVDGGRPGFVNYQQGMKSL